LIILPMLGAQLDLDLSIVSHAIASTSRALINAIVVLTGNG
jgi:hypothetical protein